MNKDKKKNKKKGFTLIEILVVVVIIGILSAVAFPSYQRALERSKAAAPIANLGSIAKAQKAYKLGTEHYTDNVRNLDISLEDELNGIHATGNTFESENFSYKVYGDDMAAAVATRKNVDSDKQYELSVDYNTGRIYCRPLTNPVCIDFNFEEGHSYDPEWEECNGGMDSLWENFGPSTNNEAGSKYCHIRSNAKENKTEYDICMNPGETFHLRYGGGAKLTSLRDGYCITGSITGNSKYTAFATKDGGQSYLIVFERLEEGYSYGLICNEYDFANKKCLQGQIHAHNDRGSSVAYGICSEFNSDNVCIDFTCKRNCDRYPAVFNHPVVFD